MAITLRLAYVKSLFQLIEHKVDRHGSTDTPTAAGNNLLDADVMHWRVRLDGVAISFVGCVTRRGALTVAKNCELVLSTLLRQIENVSLAITRDEKVCTIPGQPCAAASGATLCRQGADS